MHTDAPRLPARVWRGLSRGALLAIALWAGAAEAQEAKVVSARYEDPTDRYPHGVLGDEIEYASLSVTLGNGTTARLTWQNMVFEDTAPRLVDIDGDGAPEVITTESHQTQGARVGIYAATDGTLKQIASTPFIGQRFRWLGIAGVADLDGDGVMELAYVDRPHLAKTLRIWRIERGDGNTTRLTEVAQLAGVTNHRIGEDYISGGIRNCGQTPEIIVADAAWRRVLAVRYDGETVSTKDIGAFAGRKSMDDALKC